MWHQLLMGLLLGGGAAVPIGPVNVEMIRRNLRFGTSYGIYFGLGACSTDLTYFILLLTGLLVFLQESVILRVIGVGGSLVLIWFAVSAFRSPPVVEREFTSKKDPVIWHHYFQGYVMTLLNPMTILFWASLSASLAGIAKRGTLSEVYVGAGVIIGVVGWVLLLNLIFHITRHRLSEKAMRYLNYAGGTILLCFAIFGLFHALWQ